MNWKSSAPAPHRSTHPHQHQGRRLRCAIAALVATTFLGALTQALPAAVAAGPDLAGVACDDGPVRLLQLRDGDVDTGFATLTGSSVANPAAASPTYYSWRDIPLTFKARAVAVREQREVSGELVTYAYLTGVDDNLYMVRWSPNAAAAEDRVVTKKLTTSGTYGFHRLAFDGNRLWGVKGPDLYFISVDAAWDAPNGQSVVKRDFGYPRTFHGVFGGDAEIAYSDSTGALSYLDISGVGSGNVSVTRTAVESSGWGNSGNVWLGGGLVYRVAGVGNDLLRRQTITGARPDYVVSSYQTVATGIVAPDNRISAAPDACRRAVVSDPGSSRLASTALSYNGGPGTAACQDAGLSGGDQCKQFVNCVAVLAGQAQPSGGYHDAYSRAGYVQVTRAQARAGDIVQNYSPSVGDTTFQTGYHTAILLEPFGTDTVVRVVDANWVAPGVVGVHNYDPYGRAEAYGQQVVIWRWPGS